MMTPQLFDQSSRSDGTLTPDSVLTEPELARFTTDRPVVAQPPAPVLISTLWHFDPELSWYGPGFYGHRTTCGYAMTISLRGVANRTLPCGTLITFQNPVTGRTITVPVVDRGPYVSGRQWDLTAGTCLALDHCWTGSIYWRFR
jgi:Lytic transglycolase